MRTRFFQTAQQYIESIEEFSRPHPLSVEAAIASLKRYLSEPRYRIQLSDLVNDTVGRIVEMTSGEDFDMHRPEPTTESVTARVRAYEAACSTLLAMATVGGFWAEEEHAGMWQRALQRLGTKKSMSGNKVLWLDLQPYPATLLLYALGIGAAEGSRYRFLERVLSTKLFREHQEEKLAVRELPPFVLFSPNLSFQGGHVMGILEGMDKRYAPLNDWIHDILRPHTKRILPDDDRYTFVFDKLEILMALNYAYHGPQDWYWTLPGAFGYRYGNKNRILQEIRESLDEMGNESPLVTCNIFGKTVDQCSEGLTALDEFISKLRRGRW